MPWSVVGVCPGFTVTLVNEDFTPAPNPVPVGLDVAGSASRRPPACRSGTNCCFGIVFQCDGASSTIDICSTACDCATAGRADARASVDWTTSGTIVTFHQHWENPSSSAPTAPVSGDMSSQEFGVFLPNYGPIGPFNVPPIAPNSFFDVFIDVPLAALPPSPITELPGGVRRNALLPRRPLARQRRPDLGRAPEARATSNSTSARCRSVRAPAPTYRARRDRVQQRGRRAVERHRVVPRLHGHAGQPGHDAGAESAAAGWVGLIACPAAPGMPVGDDVLLQDRLLLRRRAGVIDVCAKACDCRPKKPPVLAAIDWTKRRRQRRASTCEWKNPNGTEPSDPVSGDMNSQPFGVFAAGLRPDRTVRRAADPAEQLLRRVPRGAARASCRRSRRRSCPVVARRPARRVRRTRAGRATWTSSGRDPAASGRRTITSPSLLVRPGSDPATSTR